MAEIQGYCLKCKEHRMMKDPKPEWAANGSPATRATCSVCGTNMYKRGLTPLHEGLPKPEITPEMRAKAKKKKKTSKKKATKSKTRRSGKLVIVESPAKAKTIGKYLGRGYTVKSSVGHVRDLLRSRLSVDLDNGYEPEYRVPNDKRPVVKDLKAAAAKASEIYLATDPDREGEAIAWHVMESAEMEPERTRRVVFHEITKDAVLEALEKPRDIDMERVNAQQARRILDRLVGYKLSPLLWRKVRGRLSAGRVQSVAVRLVVERERAIEAFTPVEYWSVHADLLQAKAGATPFRAKWHRLNGKEPVLDSEGVVMPHVAILEKATWNVGKIKLGERRRKPAAPFTTSTIQQEASRKLGFGTRKTMRIAQQLYEGIDIGEGQEGLITYMRTDSLSVSKTAQEAARVFISDNYGNEYMPATPPMYKTKSKSAQEAHEAIRPTGVHRHPAQLKKNLSKDQYRLYQLIWARFMASQMSPAVYATVSTDIYAGDANVEITKRPYMFRASGSTLKFAGFLKVYEETRPEDKPEDSDSKMPGDLAANDRLNLLKLLPEQHFTQPPPRFSEATLVKSLEEHGVGRPSTYAATIGTILQRDYVEKDGRRLMPTEIGKTVNDLLVEYFPRVLSVDFTARMEGELDRIADGESAWVPVVDAFYQPFRENLEVADEKIEKLFFDKEPEPVGRLCPTCEEGQLLYREGRYGRFIGCERFPKCRHTEQILVRTGFTCAVNGGEIIEKKTRKQRTFYGCTRYPECKWTSWTKPTGVDATGMIVEKGKDGDTEHTDCEYAPNAETENENLVET